MALSGVKLAVRQVQDRLRIWRETVEDARRHIRYSAATDGRSALSRQARQIEAQLTKDYHRIEKGLALRNPRPKFGADPAARLRRDLPRYEALDGHSPVVVSHAMSALEGLEQWHANESHTDGGPTKLPTPYKGLSEAETFFRSRASIRDFADRSLDPDIVRSAADLALCSPSVCNRQAWALWAFHDRATIDRLAALQNGNAGFREQIPCLLVVAVDARLFAGSGERNQRWIDGGLYVMSLAWALHAQGSRLLHVELVGRPCSDAAVAGRRGNPRPHGHHHDDGRRSSPRGPAGCPFPASFSRRRAAQRRQLTWPRRSCAR